MYQILLGLASGVSYGLILFLIAIGITVLFGCMGVLQLAHGAIFMFSGFFGVWVANLTGNFAWGAMASCVCGAILGVFLYRGFLRHLYNQPLLQVLLTFSFVYIITNVTLWIFGPEPVRCPEPSFLGGSISMGTLNFPAYRLGVIIMGLIIFGIVWWAQGRTKFGAIIRAARDDATMLSGLGVNIQAFMTGAFVAVSVLAGLAAIVAAPMLGGISLENGSTMLYLSLAVCIIGGLGSIEGSLIAALILGLGITFVTIYVPGLPMFIPYLLMIIVLLIRPSGLLGRRS